MYKVLIVDDEPAVISMIKRSIETKASEFEVTDFAYGVRPAITKINQSTPDVVITDIRMPGESGIDLVKYLYQREAPITTLVVSGYDDFDYVHDAFMYGAYDYLLKPVEPARIQDVFIRIKTILHKRDQITDHSPQEKRTPTNSELLIANIENYIKQHLHEDNSLVFICRQFSISQPYLSKLFKKHKGCTYNEYLNTERINAAKKLLTTRQDCLVGDIAEQCGFSDQFYFSKVFKRTVGVTPREYRSQQKG